MDAESQYVEDLKAELVEKGQEIGRQNEEIQALKADRALLMSTLNAIHWNVEKLIREMETRAKKNR